MCAPQGAQTPGGSEGLEVALLSPAHAPVPCPQMPAIAVLAAAAAAWCFLQVDSRHLDALAGGAALNNANFLDNDQWLSTVSQYDRDKYWNRFRDVSSASTSPGGGKWGWGELRGRCRGGSGRFKPPMEVYSASV